jgi:hypothetical protein
VLESVKLEEGDVGYRIRTEVWYFQVLEGKTMSRVRPILKFLICGIP